MATTNKEIRIQSSMRALLYFKALSLIERKNVLTKHEKEALRKTADTIIDTLLSDNPRRMAIPLPTGFGKSTLILSLIYILHKYQFPYQLLVCVSNNNEIVENLSALEELGVSPETVGVFMSSSYNHGAWDVTEGMAKHKKVLFITHARVYQAQDYRRIQRLCEVEGKPRLALWDESAQTTEGTYIRGANLSGQIREFLSYHGDQEDLKELQRKIEASEIGEHYLPLLEIQEYGLGNELQRLIDNSDTLLSLQRNRGTGLVITAHTKIPDEINCLIFDASAEVSGIVELDPTIEVFPVNVQRDYSRCKIICVNKNSGRASLANREELEEQLRIYKEIKGDREGLLLTPKEFTTRRSPRRTVNIPKIAKEEIPGVHVLTWGSERGVNKYSSIGCVGNIGLNHKNPDMLASNLIALSRNLDKKLKKGEVAQFQHKLFLGEIYQGISRSRIRHSKNGVALATEIVIIHNKASQIARELEKTVLPGIQIELYELADSTSLVHQREQDTERVTKYLKDFEGDKISVRKLKNETGLQNITKRQWNQVRDAVEEQLFFLWELVGRSWVKVT